MLAPRSLPSSIWRAIQSSSAAHAISSAPAPVELFDRAVKRRQRDWAAAHPDADKVEHLREEVGWRIADKVADLMKVSPRAIEIGHGMVTRHLESGRVGAVTIIEGSRGWMGRAEGPEDEKIAFTRIHGDEEVLAEVAGQKFDLALTSLSAHWINDLPTWMKRIHALLTPDSPLIGSMLAEDTLYELRCSLQLAEMERLGGISAHMSPLVRPADIGSLLGAAGFKLVTLDSDEIQVHYPSLVHLLVDLQLMGESGAALTRPLSLRRDIAIAASAIYKAMYGKPDEEAYPATFRVLSFIGWTEGPTTPKPAARGSHTHSLKDLST